MAPSTSSAPLSSPPEAPAASPLAEQLLGQLKDIQLPDPASWWPPAPGWWALAALCAFALFFVVDFVRKQMRVRRYRRDARVAFDEIRREWERGGDRIAYATSVHQLARQVAIHRFGRDRVARLTGSAFLEVVNRLSSSLVTPETAESLFEGGYRREQSFDVDRVHSEIEAWLSGLHEGEHA